MSKSIQEAKSVVSVPPWMISMEHNRKIEKATLTTIGIAMLGLATRVGITINNYDHNLPFVNKLAHALSDNLLGALQQPGTIAGTPEMQIAELLAGIAVTASVAFGSGKLIDSINNKRRLKQLIEETRKNIIETGNITETLPVSGHSIVVTPNGIPFINQLAGIIDNPLLVTQTYNPYLEENKIKGEAVFPLYIKTERVHDENTFDIANTQNARNLIVIPQSKDQMVFFDSEKSTQRGLLSVNSALESIPPEADVPTLVFIQSRDEVITSQRLTSEQYLEKHKSAGRNIEIKYLEELVVGEITDSMKNGRIYISTDLTTENRKKIERSLTKKGFEIALTPSGSDAILVYYKEDATNLMETQNTIKNYGDKPIYSLLDTEVETEEAEKTGAKTICVERIMKNEIEKFLVKYPKKNVEIPIETALRERIAVLFSKRLAIEILKKNPKETMAILNMLDFPKSLKIDDDYRFRKPRDFNHWHNLPGNKLFSRGLSTYQKVWREVRDFQLEPISAEEIASLYFHTTRPTKEQIISINTILEAGEYLGMVIPTGKRSQADGKSRMTFTGISRNVIDLGYSMLEIQADSL
jgi:hypothetical protein